MGRRGGKIRLRDAMTLLELVIAMAMIGIIFAAILPQFALIRNSWDVKQGTAEALQNGRVLMDHISRNLSKAVRITAVSESSVTSGYIQFVANDGNTFKYEYVAGENNNYVEFGPQPGTLSDLAGPVSLLKFTCYDACDLDNPLSPVTDTNDVRVVKVDATFTNSASIGQDKTFTTWVYLRTNANFGNWCAYNDCVYDPGLVGYGTDPYGNIVHYGDTNRITVYGIGTMAPDYQTPPGVRYSASSGQLKNYATSAGTGVTATLTQSGGVVWQPIVGCVSGTCWSGGYDTSVCTDAYNTFHGIVDMTGIVYYGSAGWWVDVTFTGLDPSKTYTFATSASRAKSTTDGAPGYTNRWTIYTISDVDAATNASTPGTTEVSNPYSVRFNTGNNHFEGYVARWTGIRPGTDGSFKVRATADPNSESGYKAYAFSVFELQSADEITQIAYPISYRDFNEAKAGTDTTSLAISTSSSTAVGDLLIAAVATDGSTTFSTPSGWYLIDQGSCGSEVTLGAWWRNASAAGVTSHTFAWSGGSEQAYGWMMRFTGHNSASPISNYSTAGVTSSNPTSPAVTTAVGCSLILRLGAFDDNDVNTLPEPGNPGLSGHTAITADMSSISQVQNQDIGAVSLAGSATYASGTWTIEAQGSDIWANSDAFHYVYQPFTGDGQIVARVVSVENTNKWAKAGVMIRETLNASSKHAMMIVTPVQGTDFQYRPVTNASSYSGTDGSGTGGTYSAPYWVKLIRSGNNFSGYHSPDGSAWTQVGTTVSISMSSNVYIGLAVTSHTSHSLCAAVVDNVTGLSTPSSGGIVSGGAGYVKQSSSGSSGTSTFSLGSSNEARTLTIAIAPADTTVHDCCGDLRP